MVGQVQLGEPANGYTNPIGAPAIATLTAGHGVG